MQSVSETGYLPPLYQCWLNLVKSFFSSLSGLLIAVVLGPEIVIGWARIGNRWRKALSQHRPSPGKDRYSRVTSAADSLFAEENAWATQ